MNHRLEGDWLCAVDTNIVDSSMMSRKGNEHRLMRLLRNGTIPFVVSLPILTEYRTVLYRAKFHFDPREVEDTLQFLEGAGALVTPQRVITLSPHEPDNRLLECVEAAGAAFLITGNLRHFPAVHGITRIVNARSFLDQPEFRTPG